MKPIILALLFLAGCAMCGSSSEITPTANIPPTLIIEFWKSVVLQKDAKIALMQAQQDFKDANTDRKEALGMIVEFCAAQGKALKQDKNGDMTCDIPPKEAVPHGEGESMPWLHPQQLPISNISPLL